MILIVHNQINCTLIRGDGGTYSQYGYYPGSVPYPFQWTKKTPVQPKRPDREKKTKTKNSRIFVLFSISNRWDIPPLKFLEKIDRKIKHFIYLYK